MPRTRAGGMRPERLYEFNSSGKRRDDTHKARERRAFNLFTQI